MLSLRRLILASLMSVGGSTALFSAPPEATPAKQVRLLPGFQVELLYSVPQARQGSWVNMTVDPRGRLLVSHERFQVTDEGGSLYRITPPALGGDPADTKVQKMKAPIGAAHGLLYAFDSLYVMVNAGDKSGLYRLRDTNGDDEFDELKLLRKLSGGGEHGPHAILLSPDGKSLTVCAGNHTDPTEFQSSRVPRNWQEDQVLPRMWDAGGHAVGRMAPGGWIARVDPEGKNWELLSSGYRNEFDIAFNSDGELFTFDADMEWDIGSPWYRPTRVNHVVSGSEFGWRSGTGKWPEYYPDSLNAVVDIGPGSPTGIVFGTGAKFPAKYQRALFLCDWSYGLIYAVHMTPSGSSYTATAEQFATAAPFAVTDMVVNPHDGALYVTVGGRGTQSGLYRITYQGSESTEMVPFEPNPEGGKERSLRRKLENHHKRGAGITDEVWANLGSGDRHLRYAARVALEHQPVESWQQRALAKTGARGLINAMVALARQGDKSLQPQIVQALGRLSWSQLDVSARLELLRAYGLTFARHGAPAPSVRESLLDTLNGVFPAEDVRVNRELCSLLVFLEAPEVAARTLDLLKQAPTQEEQIHYLLCLRNLKVGWSVEQRRTYFESFRTVASHRGGHSFTGFLKNIHKEAADSLDDATAQALGDLVKAPPAPAPVEGPARKLVKKWQVDELLQQVDKATATANLKRGRAVFTQALCYKCHRFRGQGGITGPDLTGVAGRFNNRNLLESLLEPNKVVSDQYATSTFVLADGRTVSGRVVNLSGNRIMVMTDMLNPGRPASVNRDQVDEVLPSTTSLMPTGLLDTFTAAEVLDLIAYLRSGGKRSNATLKAAARASKGVSGGD